MRHLSVLAISTSIGVLSFTGTAGAVRGATTEGPPAITHLSVRASRRHLKITATINPDRIATTYEIVDVIVNSTKCRPHKVCPGWIEERREVAARGSLAADASPTVVTGEAAREPRSKEINTSESVVVFAVNADGETGRAVGVR